MVDSKYNNDINSLLLIIEKIISDSKLGFVKQTNKKQ